MSARWLAIGLSVVALGALFLAVVHWRRRRHLIPPLRHGDVMLSSVSMRWIWLGVLLMAFFSSGRGILLVSHLEGRRGIDRGTVSVRETVSLPFYEHRRVTWEDGWEEEEIYRLPVAFLLGLGLYAGFMARQDLNG